MDVILCPQCGHENPIEASVCGQCNADLSPVKSIVDTANSHYNQALSLAHAGQLDEAIGQLQAAIALSSQNPAFYNLLGTISAQKGLFSEAIRAWEQCLALNPEMEKAFNNIDKARRMEEVRAEEHEQRPQWMTSLIATIAAGVFLVTTLILGINSYSKSSKINKLTDDIIAKEKETSSWKSQFESLTSQFPQEGLNGVLKKLTQSETLIADRDKRVQDLEQKMERASENYRDRINEFRDNIRTLQQEKSELQQQLKSVDAMKTVITQNETQIETLQNTVTSLQESLKAANERAETHRSNLLLAQNNVRELQDGREAAIEAARKTAEKQEGQFRTQILELRDEIASRERTAKDHQYADALIAEAIQHLDNNEFELSSQNIQTALERYPESPLALYLRNDIDGILDDPLEREIRILEKQERESKRAEIKKQLVSSNLQKAKQEYNAGRFDSAIDLTQRALALDPDNPKEAENLKEILNQSQERNREIVLLLAEAQKDINDENYKDADSKLKQIIKRSPSHEDAKALLDQLSQ